MTHTLTTETLRALRDSLKSWQDGYDPVDDKEQYEMFVTAETAVGELLANREAQPVGYIAEVSGNRVGVLRGLPMPDVGSLIYTAPPAPAPAVPEEMTGDGVLAMHDCGYIEGWNACRTAMLAQPVSQGYKLVPVEPTENMIIDGFESDAFMALADAVNEENGWPYGCKESAVCVEGIFKAMLAAAPEGGNG